MCGTDGAVRYADSLSEAKQIKVYTFRSTGRAREHNAIDEILLHHIGDRCDIDANHSSSAVSIGGRHN